MSAMSEQGPTSPQDPAHYAPRRSSERSELRLSAIGSVLGETAFDRTSLDRTSKPGPAGRPPAPTPSLNAELEHAVYESLRRQMDPQVVPEPAALRRERSRPRGLLTVGGGIAAAVVVSAVLALLFVNFMPASRDRDAGASLLARAASSTLSQPVEDDGSKPALSQFKSVLAATEEDQGATREQSERLLEQFMQWRQKAKSAETPR